MHDKSKAAAQAGLDPSSLTLIAHELRQPLTAALGSCLALSEGVIRKSMDMGDQQLLLDIIKRNLQQLDRLLNTLHAYGELTSDRLELKPRIIHVLELLEASRDAFDPVNATMLVTIECSPEMTVEADPTLMLQVLTNLLGNAKKFAPPGSEVMLGAYETEGLVVITVTDQGGGVAPQDRTRIFDQGVSGDQSRGLGLGLYISRAVVAAHGGRIWVDDPEEGGSRFNIALPEPAQPL